MDNKLSKVCRTIPSIMIAALAALFLAGCHRSEDKATTLEAAGGRTSINAASLSVDSSSPEVNATNTVKEGVWGQNIKGLVGSEKMSFLQDPRVVSIFAKNGISMYLEKAGSREILTKDLKGYDFAFPSGAPAAMEIASKAKVNQTYNVFYTPLAIATWKPVALALEKEGILKTSLDGHLDVDMSKMISIMSKGERFRDLKGSEGYSSSKSILISSTDVRTSNSAAMYLAVISYTVNGANVISTDEQAKKAADIAAPLFARQGMQDASSAGPFEDYVSMGMGKAPLVWIYESQFIEHKMKEATLNGEMVLIYPEPEMFSKSVIVPLTSEGRRVGQIMMENPELRKIATEYGYRLESSAELVSMAKSKGIPVATNFVDVIDPPSMKMLDSMIEQITAKLQ